MKVRDNIIKQEVGSALFLVLLAMVVVFLMVTGLITLAVGENIHSSYQGKETKAYYLARSGAESMAKEFYRLSEAELDLIRAAGPAGVTANASNAVGALEILSGTGTVSVTVTNDPIGSGHFLISATGNHNGHQETVSIWMIYENDVVYELDYAVYSENTLKKNDANGDINWDYIEGDIAAGDEIYIHTDEDGNVLGPGTLNGSYYPHYAYSFLPYNIVTPDTLGFAGPVQLMEGTDIVINESSIIYDDFKNATLSINTDNGLHERSTDSSAMTVSFEENPSATDQWMVVYLQGGAELGGTLEVTGSKNLVFFVEDYLYTKNLDIDIAPGIRVECYVPADGDDGYDLKLEGSSSINYTDPDQLEFVVYGDHALVDLSNNGRIYARFMVPDGRFEFTNGNTELYGNLYANDVIMGSQTTIYYQIATNTEYDIGVVQRIDISHWDR